LCVQYSRNLGRPPGGLWTAMPSPMSSANQIPQNNHVNSLVQCSSTIQSSYILTSHLLLHDIQTRGRTRACDVFDPSVVGCCCLGLVGAWECFEPEESWSRFVVMWIDWNNHAVDAAGYAVWRSSIPALNAVTQPDSSLSSSPLIQTRSSRRDSRRGRYRHGNRRVVRASGYLLATPPFGRRGLMQVQDLRAGTCQSLETDHWVGAARDPRFRASYCTDALGSP